MLPLSLSHQDWHSQAGFATVIVAKVLKPQDEHHIEMITSQLYEWMYACPLQGYRTLSPRLSANIGRSDSYRLSGIILNCTQLYYNCIFPFSLLYSYFINIKRSDTDGLRTCYNICLLYCSICVYFLSLRGKSIC